VATYLDRILAAHREAAAADRRALDRLVAQALAAPEPRAFEAAIREAGGVALIAEVKRRSPRGPLDPGLDPAQVAREYREGGASCLSVLTDWDFFGGSAEDLAAARGAGGLPTLRKDFTVGTPDVCDARIMGADAVLLIAAALPASQLAELAGLARQLGLDALVEVHGEEELEVALRAGASLVGVNQRDLATFQVDPGRAERLRPLIPSGVLAVAESGIGGPADVRRLAEAGYDAVLVGSSLVAARDRRSAVASLVEAGTRTAAGAGGQGCS
jgi:indole-3-glycerol phosphate synthase